jgi:signal transduction histidine kinase
VATAHLLQRSNDEFIRSAGQRLINSSSRMARLIEDLLDFSRARLGGGIAVQPEPGDLYALTRRVLQEHQAATPARQIQLTHAGSLRCAFDGERMAQITSNLVGNALQHGTGDGPVRVHLEGSDPMQISLSVSNPGDIPAQLVGSIFEPFRGRRESGAARGTGLGLGLYIVQQLARAHGGDVAVNTGDGNTSFTVVIPRTSNTQAGTRADAIAG